MLVTKSALKNCLSCASYLNCKDSLKSVLYRCKSYKDGRNEGRDSMQRLFGELGLDAPTLDSSKIIQSVTTTTMDNPMSRLDTFDIHSLIEDAIDSKSIVSPDLKLKDGDFKLAPNFLDFCLSDHGLKTKPYVSQALIAIKLFGEYCYKCSDLEYFDGYNVKDSLGKMQTKIALLEHGKCRHCNRTQAHYYSKSRLDLYSEIAVAAGQRSGKSALVAMLSAYVTHRFLKLSNPNEVYGLARSNVFHGTFVALTYAQAKDTLWDPFYGNLLESPWFQGYHSLLSDYHDRTGEELFKLNDTFVSYKHRRLVIYPAGPDKRTLRGRTRAFACLTGDSLVSTNRGLLRMDDPRLLGAATHSQKSDREITNHVMTGRREAFRINTKVGITQRGTANHEFRVLSPCRTHLIWKRVDQLTTKDYMVVSVGGSFPDRLDLSSAFSWERQQTRTDILFDWMIENGDGFTLEAAAAACNRTYRGVTSVISGINKKQPKALSRVRIGPRSPFTYVVSDEEALLAAAPNDSGKIQKKFAALKFPSEMTPELAYIIGYLVADGNYVLNHYEITFTSTSVRKIQHYSQCFKSCFGFTPRISSWITAEGRRAFNAVFALGPLKDFFSAIGLTPAWSAVKQVPWCILEAPRECVAAFLSAAISCDGGIKNDRLYYASRSIKLIRQMQLLFLRLGYMCTSTKSRTSSLHLTSYDRDRFLERDFTGLVKRSWHDDPTASGRTGTSRIRHYKIPGVKAPHKSRSGDWACVYTKSEMNIRPSTTSRYSDIIDKDICFTRVTSITPIGARKVYDISVSSKDYEFTVNGGLSHNSIDEIGWFDNSADTNKVKLSANEVYIALERSLLTVRAAAFNLWERGFTSIPTGYFFNVSSPSSVRDKVMELVRKAQGSKKILGLVRPTWEMNPNVSRKHLAEEFKADPIAAMRDYGAEPPLSSNAFLTQAMVDGAVNDKRNFIVLRHLTKKSKKTNDVMRYAEIEKVKRSGKPSCLALDAGYVNNSFAFACGHLDSHKFPIIDLVGEIQPLPGVRLNFSRIYKHVILPLIDERNVKLVAADRWNSIKILSDVEEDTEAETRQYSLTYPDMQLFKDYIENKQILFPDPKRPLEDLTKYNQSDYPACFKDDPIAHFYLQMLTVQDTGRSVVKGDQLTDDMVRASMLCVRMLLDERHEDLWATERVEVKGPTDMNTLAASRGYSGGGGGSSAAAQSIGQSIGVRKSRQ